MRTGVSAHRGLQAQITVDLLDLEGRLGILAWGMHALLRGMRVRRVARLRRAARGAWRGGAQPKPFSDSGSTIASRKTETPF